MVARGGDLKIVWADPLTGKRKAAPNREALRGRRDF
jgi:hypothetical protein